MVRWQRTEVAKFGTGGEANNFYLKVLEQVKRQFPQTNPQVFRIKWGTGQMAKLVFHMDFKDEEEMTEITQKIKEDDVIKEIYKSRAELFIDGSTYDTTFVTTEPAG